NMIDTPHPFTPDWISPPGDTIADLLEERDWTQAHLAHQLGYSIERVSQLVNGKAILSHDTALRLASVLGNTASFWLEREAHYRDRLAARPG
ncbi:MAG: HigA family addiction module antitoxin, partial [Cyanobacteria bacterium J06639_1]